jgi:hypothetical protein
MLKIVFMHGVNNIDRFNISPDGVNKDCFDKYCACTGELLIYLKTMYIILCFRILHFILVAMVRCVLTSLTKLTCNNFPLWGTSPQLISLLWGTFPQFCIMRPRNKLHNISHLCDISRRADSIMASFQMICHIPESDTF